MRPRLFLSALLCLGSLPLFAAEAGLPEGVTLPPGMSVGEAKAAAQAQGITTRAQAEAAAREQGIRLPSGGKAAVETKAPTKADATVDAEEGEVKSEEGEAKADPTVGARKLRSASDVDSMRYGQRIFRTANPSLFASHVGAVGSSYQLGAGDQVILTLWGQKEARYELTLDRSGQISVEGVGLVSLNGLSMKDAQALLRNRLTRLYSGMASGQTSMDLTLGKLRQIRVFVNGDVVAPGSYLLPGNTNVFNALYQAKGPSQLGTERRIEILRGGARLTVDLYGYLFKGVHQGRDLLQDGDIVRVPVRGPVVEVRGEVGRPGRYELLPTETAKDLLGYCGGITVNTATQKILVTRIFEDGRREALAPASPGEILAGKQDVRMKDGDYVFVFKGKDPSRQTVRIGGEVRFPGSYPWVEGMKVEDLVRTAGGLTPAVYDGHGVLVRNLVDGSRATRQVSVKPVSGELLSPNDSVGFFNRFVLLRPREVRVSGAVLQPGTYPLDSGMTVRDLLLQAGGMAKEAEGGALRLETPIEGAEGAAVRPLSLAPNLEGADGAVLLKDGDHLAVPSRLHDGTLALVSVKGMAAFPGTYALRSSGERITSVLARAGGIRPDGYPSGTWLIRPVVGRIAINVARALAHPGGNDDLVLRGGDTLMVPVRPATVTVSGRVNDPSNIPWREGKSWKWYVSMAGGMTDSADEDRVYLRLADGSVQTRDYGIDSLPNPGSEIVVPFRKPPEPMKYTDIIGALGATASLILSAVTIFFLVSKN